LNGRALGCKSYKPRVAPPCTPSKGGGGRRICLTWGLKAVAVLSELNRSKLTKSQRHKVLKLGLAYEVCGHGSAFRTNEILVFTLSVISISIKGVAACKNNRRFTAGKTITFTLENGK